MLLTDNETKVDLLNNEAIATTIVDLLRSKPDRPVTIGVHGDWGAGKSSVLEMIEAGMAQHKGTLCLKFNGWRYQGFEDAKIALIEDIVTNLVNSRSLFVKSAEAVKDIFKRVDALKAAKKYGGTVASLAVKAYTLFTSPDQLPLIVPMLEGIINDPAALAEDKAKAMQALSDLQEVLKPAEEKHVPQEIAAFRKAFEDLLTKAGIEQLVVLIDDLDRCLPDTAIETLEAVRLFVFTSRTAFVVAADEAMIEYSVRKHFPDLPDTTGPQSYARNYLEKLIQVPFRIPALGESETRMYVSLLLAGMELGEDSKTFESLLKVAREKLKRPWVSGALDAGELKATLGADLPKVQSSLTLSEQIGPILASGTKGNPRQIKRFLNTLVLRQLTAKARGFAEDVRLPVLAKLMLAERFIPNLFDQIATVAAVAPDGVCKDLTELEGSVATERAGSGPKANSEEGEQKQKAGEKEPKKESKRAEAVKLPESVVLSDWLANAPVRAWAAVQPPLAGVDLRPYLFVSKDRKNFFGAQALPMHLVGVVELLLGSKIAVQGLDPQLRKLQTLEASQVFEAVRGRVITNDSFEREPPGVAGLITLVRVHQTLQDSLIDFIEAIPSERLGPWVCKGWDGVLKDQAAQQRFKSLLEHWRTNSKSGALRTAADVALRPTDGRLR